MYTWVFMFFNPFPITSFLDCPDSKDAADDNWNVAIKGFLDRDCIENIVEKDEIAHFEQIHLYPQCFPKALFLMCWNEYIWREGLKNAISTFKIKRLGWSDLNGVKSTFVMYYKKHFIT